MRVNAFNIWLVGLPRSAKRWVMVTADAIALPLLMYLAFSIRLGDWPPSFSGDILLMLALVPVIAIPLLYLAGFYRAVVRFLGSEMVWGILAAVSITALTLEATLYMGRAGGIPHSVTIIFWAFAILYLAGSRFLARRYLVWSLRDQVGRVPVAIYGAGSCGVQLAFALSQASKYLPLVFVDDNAYMHGSLIQGIRVIAREKLAATLKRHDIETVLLALPSVSRQRRLEIVHFLEALSVHVKSVPALPDVVSGKARVEDVHNVEIEDLLGREPVPPDAILLSTSVTAHSVMVTGAGGSIGSELCRQILAQKPSRLLLFERSEYALYAIEQELLQQLQRHDLHVEVVPILGSVTDHGQVESVCRDYQVQTLFHAAAYKHVPLVEANPAAGVENNILGTYHTALAAEAAGVNRFVLISTDKTVRPTSVMGATKRFAEIILQALSEKGSKTIFAMVRFGNVLGSSGSVVPLFRKQILAGGPVTLTHREITRYFMTIPEAAQLVIQAGAMAKGGEVFVLDMGEPVRIHDLACTMIQLMGFSVRDETNPNGDIEVTVTGLRPGEKLYEELLIGSDSTATHHPMIMQAHEPRLSWQEVVACMQQFDLMLHKRDSTQLLTLLQRNVQGYQPTNLVKQPMEIIETDTGEATGG
jgi:FlaA1/EpsC-like NDP-sugar epimerase